MEIRKGMLGSTAAGKGNTKVGRRSEEHRRAKT
jgi:hypothetical protein